MSELIDNRAQRVDLTFVDADDSLLKRGRRSL